MANTERDRDHADLLKFNRALIRALRRRDNLVKKLDQANADLLEARRMVRWLIDRLKQQPAPARPRCLDCGDTEGTNVNCPTCQAFGTFTDRVADAHTENP